MDLIVDSGVFDNVVQKLINFTLKNNYFLTCLQLAYIVLCRLVNNNFLFAFLKVLI